MAAFQQACDKELARIVREPYADAYRHVERSRDISPMTGTFERGLSTAPGHSS